MSWFWPIFAIFIIAVWVYALVDIVRRRHAMSRGKIAAWVLIILIFPILGALAYFVVNGTSGSSGAPRDAEVGGRPL